MIMLEGKLTRVIFPSLCNIIVINALVLVLEINITCIIFPSYCNVFDVNVVVPVVKLTCIRFHS